MNFKDFVPYGIANLAFLSGYDDTLLSIYEVNQDRVPKLIFPFDILVDQNILRSIHPSSVLAPTYFSLSSWLENKYGYICWVEEEFGNYYPFSKKIGDKKRPRPTKKQAFFTSKLAAYNAVLEEMLKTLS